MLGLPNKQESERGNQMTDFDSMTTAQLKAYAREHHSTISKLSKRSDLVRALKAMQAKQQAEAAKPVSMFVGSLLFEDAGDYLLGMYPVG